MTAVMLCAAVVVAVPAAARSTWSPCGLSMLSSITPFGERARRHRYGVTAAWFVGGAAVGGATLGAGAAGLAALLRLVGVAQAPTALLVVGAAVAAVGAAVDAGLLGPVLPLLRRQVDDRWLSRYRPWVYGAGFGWQIGVGFATYLMTAGVVVVVLLAALTASPAAALLAGVCFGAARGLTVYLTARCADPAALRALHRRLERLGAPVRWAVVGVQAGTTVGLGLLAAGVLGPVGAGLGGAGLGGAGLGGAGSLGFLAPLAGGSVGVVVAVSVSLVTGVARRRVGGSIPVP